MAHGNLNIPATARPEFTLIAAQRGNETILTSQLSRDGDRYCGGYDTTVQMGNHVDDGDLSDWTFTPMPHQAFHVHYHLQGTVGNAVLQSVGNELRWKDLGNQRDGKDVDWIFRAPKSATLIKQLPDKVRSPPHC